MGNKKILGVALASLAGLATLAPAAFADPRFAVSFSTDNSGATTNYSGVYDSSAPNYDHSGETVQLVRNSAVVATATGTSDQTPFVSTSSLVAGDQLHFTGNGADRTWTYDGLPSFDLTTACIGSRAFGGNVGTTIPAQTTPSGSFSAGAFGPDNGSGWAQDITDTQKANGNGTFNVTTKRALVAGDHVLVQENFVDGDSSIFENAYRSVGACVVPAPPAAPAPQPTPIVAPPTAQQVLAGLQSMLGTQTTLLSKMDLSTVVDHGSVDVPFTFMVPGKVEFTWDVAGAAGRATASAARAKKPVRVARGAKALPVPGSAKVKLKLTKAGKKLLRKAKSMRVTFTAKFTPVGGAAQTTATHLTLKKHAKKAKKQAAKKAKKRA